MINKILQSAAVILGIGILVVILAIFFRLNYSRAAATAVFVSAADLQAAGFIQAKPLTPTASGRFSGPNLYFEVSDKVTAPSSEAPNIVMAEVFVVPYQLVTGALFNYRADSRDFQVLGGSGKEATMADGRVAINFIKNYHYDVIIGPSKTKIEALASLLAGKIQ